MNSRKIEIKSQNDLLLKAKRLINNSFYKKALDLLEGKESLFKADIDYYLLICKLYCHFHFYTQSLDLIKRGLLIEPENPKALYYRGLSYRELEKIDKAERDFKKVIVLAPDLDLGYYGLGLTHNDTRQYDKSIAFYEKSLMIDPGCASSYLSLGIVYANLRDYETAVKYIKLAISKDPGIANYYYNVGAIYIHQKRNEEAMRWFRKGIKAEPYYALNYQGIAKLYLDLGEYNKAIEYFNESIKRNDELSNSYFGLGVVYLRQPNRNLRLTNYYFIKTLTQIYHLQSLPPIINFFHDYSYNPLLIQSLLNAHQIEFTLPKFGGIVEKNRYQCRLFNLVNKYLQKIDIRTGRRSRKAISLLAIVYYNLVGYSLATT